MRVVAVLLLMLAMTVLWTVDQLIEAAQSVGQVRVLYHIDF